MNKNHADKLFIRVASGVPHEWSQLKQLQHSSKQDAPGKQSAKGLKNNPQGEEESGTHY
jgi:hypothetical protein